jgi:hypothetical protein
MLNSSGNKPGYFNLKERILNKGKSGSLGVEVGTFTP